MRDLEIGLADLLTVDQQDVHVEGAGAPSLGPNPGRCPLEAPSISSSSRGDAAVSTATTVLRYSEFRARRPVRSRRLPYATTLSPAAARLSTAPWRCESIAEVRSDPEVRAPHCSMRTATVDHRPHRWMELADRDDDAVDALVLTAHLGDAHDRSSSWYRSVRTTLLID
jgi:hypothetical protein